MSAADESATANTHSGTAGQGSTNPGPDTSTIFDGDSVRQCEAIVEDFRRGKTGYAGAIIELAKILKSDDEESLSEGDAKARQKGLDTFFGQLQEIIRGWEQVFDRQLPQPGASGEGHHDLPRQDEGNDLDDDGEGWITQETHKRRREPSEDEDDEEPECKCQIDQSLFPFAVGGEMASLSSDLRKSLKLKRNYLLDLSFTKQCILGHPDCPDIPEVLWKDILQEAYIDLDKILSAEYSVVGDHRGTIKLGQYELVSAPTKPSRHIKTHGEWTIAWGKYQLAVVFAFPHRSRELQQYFAAIS